MKLRLARFVRLLHYRCYSALSVTDVLTPAQRRLNMSRIRGKDTKPEMLVRRGLHARGLRFRVHRKDLPGCPDLVFPRFHSVVFVHGCFWHGHECPMFKIPSTRAAFWRRKIDQNIKRDQAAQATLIRDQWRVLTVWECALRGPGRRSVDSVLNEISRWLDPNDPADAMREIAGPPQ